MIFCRSTIEVV